jgi:hypothetical protein
MKYYTSTTEFNCGIDLHVRQMYVCVMDRQGKKLVHPTSRTTTSTFSSSSSNPINMTTWTDAIAKSVVGPFPFGEMLDYSVNSEPKSFSLPNIYMVMADGAFQLFDVTRINEAPKVLQSVVELNDWAGSADGRLAAAADSSGMVRLWDLATLQPVAILKCSQGFFCFS